MVHHNHHKAPHMHFLNLIVCLLTSVGAVNWGLKPLGYNLVELLGKYTSPAIVNPVYYIIGVAGVIGLIHFFMKLADPECRC